MKRSRQTNSFGKPKPSRRKRQTLAELRALQRLMAQAVMRPLTPGQRMRPRWTDGRATKLVAASFIKPNERLTAFDRLEIYNRQYWFRLIECFYDDYPGLRAVLGEKRFRDLAMAYLTNYPSKNFTLRNLSGQLIHFIQSEPRRTSPQTEIALDMARLEWAHIEAFDNEQKPPLAIDDLAGRDAAEIHLGLQPHITLLQLAYPLDNYLLALRKNSRLHETASNAVENPLKAARAKSVRIPARRTIRLAVHRYDNVVYYKRLTARQFVLLIALQKGASLERALQTLPDTRNASPVQDWFKQWSALGWFWFRK